jgi:hypothetical protein
MKKTFLAAVLATAAVVPMQATMISTTKGGSVCAGAGICSAVADAVTISFDGLNGQTLSYTEGNATFSGGPGSPFVTGAMSGNWAAPPSDTTTYLTIGSPGRPSSVTIDFANPINYYGFFMGSPDTYNFVDFYEGSTRVARFNGGDLINPANGSWATGQYLNFAVNDGTVSRIVMSSTGIAFETDNHAYVSAVPEPMSMALAGAGLIAIGYIGHRRRRRA